MLGVVDQIGAVESVKAASDIVESPSLIPFPPHRITFEFKSGIQYAPISGTIQEINENLNDRPGLLNKSPEDEGKRSP